MTHIIILGASTGWVPTLVTDLLEVMRPQAVCQKWITQGVLEDDRGPLRPIAHSVDKPALL